MQVENISFHQLRAARAALGLSVREVAELTGIGTATIVRCEDPRSAHQSTKRTTSALITFYESVGIKFIGTPDDRPGIRINTK
ncbi:helix-turn-helix domain-containing protein [Rhodobacterales bacterium LSUCC1028]|nr:helix-turn-helix domain-containing protein [Rhodobacterales bacterium LSUCC1028]